MILQLHHQFKDGTTNFISQFEISDHLNEASKKFQLRQRVNEMWENNPPSENAILLLCWEGSEFFVYEKRSS